MTGELEFICPRCGRETQDRFWGPCGTCRDDLARRAHRDAREVATAAFEPKMNVVPNQVATKE